MAKQEIGITVRWIFFEPGAPLIFMREWRPVSGILPATLNEAMAARGASALLAQSGHLIDAL